MARPYRGITAPRHDDPEVRNDLMVIDEYLREVDASIGRLGRGQVPTSSGAGLGTVIPDLAGYFLLAGRSPSQTGSFGILSSESGVLADNAESAAGNVSTGILSLVGGTVRVRHGSVSNTGDIFEVTNPSGSSAWLSTADNGITSFVSSTTAGVVSIGWCSGGPSLIIGSGGNSTIINYKPNATSFDHTVEGTGSISWAHDTIGNALAGTWTGNFLFNPPSGTTATVPLTVRGRASQSGNLQQWQDSTPTVLSYIAADGTFNGPVTASGLTTLDHLVIDNATASDVLLRTVPHASQSANILEFPSPGAALGTYQDSTGCWFFDSALGATGTYGEAVTFLTDSAGALIWGLIRDKSGGDMLLQVDGAVTGLALIFPRVGGTLVTTTATQILSNKTLAVSTVLKTASSVSGTVFSDNTTAGKQLRFILSTAATAVNILRINSTAARTYDFTDTSGNIATDTGVVCSDGEVLTYDDDMVVI